VNNLSLNETPVKAHCTIRKHPRLNAWKALVISARGEQPVPASHRATRQGAEAAARWYADRRGLEYREPAGGAS